jgi:hypothetical protein
MDSVDELIQTLIEKGQGASEIKHQLEHRYQLDSQTADERIAIFLSKHATAQANLPNRERKARIRMTGLTDMAIGGAVCAVAVIIFLGTLRDGGGLTIIWGGLIVFGMYRFIEGLWAFLRGRF